MAASAWHDAYSYTDNCLGCGGEWNYGDYDFAYTLTGGYRLTSYIATEVFSLDSASLGWDESPVFVGDLFDVFSADAAINLTSYRLSVMGILPFADRWEAYIRGGVALGDHWHVRPDYAYFGIDDDLLALSDNDDAY